MIVERMRGSIPFRVTLFTSEWITAIVLSVITSFFNVFKSSTYVPTLQYQPDWHVIFWFSARSAVAAYYVAVKILSISTKEGEVFRSKILEGELKSEKAAKDSAVAQRDRHVNIAAFARQLVTRKSDRLSSIVSSDVLTVETFLDHLNPSIQVGLALKIIHEFFKPKNVNSRLRLALWAKANPEVEYLSPVYSWDGTSENCFSNRSGERMRLMDPLGPRSEVVRLYHSSGEPLKIIPDCERAATNREFQFFYPEQAQKVRSMLLYKYIFMRQKQPVAIILMLVSEEADLFKLEGKDAITLFLEEILMRVEMEWIMLELVTRLNAVGR